MEPLLKPRIAVAGISIESNAFAPTSNAADFEATFDVTELQKGRALLNQLPALRHRANIWDLIPLVMSEATSGGPVDHRFFEKRLSDLVSNLRARGPFDGVLILAHGAGLTTDSEDLDGDYFGVIRNEVGTDIPIVAFLDLHGNVSSKMARSVDMLVAMRKNPHTDIPERVEECLQHLEYLLAGNTVYTARRRLPLITSQISQLTAIGEPYGDLMHWIENDVLNRPSVHNVSVLPGFSFNDCSYFGFDILVSMDDDKVETAETYATEISARAWADRRRYMRELTPLDQVGKIARAASAANTQVILADIADNPGGGGRSNTTYILEKLIESQARDVFLGLFFDPAVIEQAWVKGESHRGEVTFNAEETASFSNPLTVNVEIVRLVHKPLKNTLGMAKGERTDLGRSALLRIGEDTLVAVTELRKQILSSDYVSHFGIDPEQFSTFVVKSRGHFRAGFDHLVGPDGVFEIDCPGLTTANVESIEFQSIPRPIYPFDDIETEAFLHQTPIS